ncbi:N-6 DNA methylase [Variovorax sp. MHTC-1]|uniref:N-6 DNA methylase n=1 Tax=Variovorax sp. MHTC-1 TaxID=2495593 RepID=UPI001C8D88DE|nr:N-6 DNA methylase [Variovorax sp. MHTC-1]
MRRWSWKTPIRASARPARASACDSTPTGATAPKRQNQLTQDHVDEIVNAYQNREVEEGYSKRVTMEEIALNGHNLNISRYVSTTQVEAEIDLAARTGSVRQRRSTWVP